MDVAQGWETYGRAKCSPREDLKRPPSQFSLTKIEHNIASRRNAVISR